MMMRPSSSCMTSLSVAKHMVTPDHHGLGKGVRTALLFALLGIAATRSEAQVVTATSNSSTLQRLLDSVVPAAMDSVRVPGVVIAIVRRDSVLAMRGFGLYTSILSAILLQGSRTRSSPRFGGRSGRPFHRDFGFAHGRLLSAGIESTTARRTQAHAGQQRSQDKSA